MRKKALFGGCLIVSFVIIMGCACEALAGYGVDWFFVQRRCYEDGHCVRRIAFGLIDESGAYPAENLLEAVKLLDPDGKQVAVRSLAFSTEQSMGGTYEPYGSRWLYDEALKFDSWFHGDVRDGLKEGTYRLIVTFDGVTSEKDFSFNGLVKLPVVASSSIIFNIDRNGNLFCRWKIPNRLYYLSDRNPQLQLSARVDLDCFDANHSYLGACSINIPAGVDRAFIPIRVLDKLRGLPSVDHYNVRIMLRTRDNNNRTYSDYVELTL